MELIRSVVDRLPSWFTDNPMVRGIAEAQRKAAFEERQAVADRISASRSALSTASETHEHRIGPLRAAADAAKAKYEAANTRLLAAQRAKANELHALTIGIERDERTLRDSADGRIDEAARAMRDRWESERHAAFRAATVNSGQMNDRLQPILKNVTNEAAIRRLLAAIRDARAAFEALKLENPPDVGAAIAAIEATVEDRWAAVGELEPVSQRAA